jgi:glycosyltransferase involved in cell wall biosynthesis
VATGELEPVPVTFVSSHAALAGSEVYLERLMQALGSGWVRGVICLEDGPFVGRLGDLGIPVEVVPTPARLGILAASRRLGHAVRRQDPAVVHANGIKAALVAVLATRTVGLPIVWVKHDFSWDGPLARAIARRCHAVIGVSSAVVASLGPRLMDRVRVVPNGIPDTAIDRSGARALVRGLTGWPEELTVVAMLGRLDPVKGQRELVEAAPAVLARRPDTRFLIVGDPDRYQPEYAESLQRRIGELGLDGVVTVHAAREDALMVLAGSDLVATPTLPDARGRPREGFGLVGVESMSVGTPVVGYATGAIPEILGPCATLVAPGDRVGLAQAILAVLEDGQLQSRLRACGRQRFNDRYRLPAMVQAMKECYREAALGSAT